MNKKEFESYIESLGKVRKINEVEGYEIVKLKDNLKPCALGCNKVVKDQVIEKQKMFYPEIHWRIKCQQCRMCIHPDLNNKELIHQNSFQAEFIKFFNNKDK